jgi:hypothetical protein
MTKNKMTRPLKQRKKITSGVILRLVHDYNKNGNTTFTLHTSRIKKDNDPIISPSIT